jgi:uncharacterized protein YPO0396
MMDNNGCGLILPCMWCGSTNNHTLGCQRPKEANTRTSGDTIPIKVYRDDAACEAQLRAKAQASIVHPEYTMLMWHTAEWAVEEIDRLRAILKEANEYLNTNRLTNVAHGSVLHQKFKEEAKS